MRASDNLGVTGPAGDAPPALERGTSVGRFLVLGLVGRGAMGEVYAAYDPGLDRKIAIKLLRTRHGEAPEYRARLMREAKATAKVSHANVVVVYEAGTFGDRVFIAMEFVEGHTLRYWLQAQRRDWQEILDAFVAAGRGLGAAHDKDLVHRDFKPDNVMVSAQGGQVRVMDFGLARFVANESADVLEALADLEGTIEIARSGAHRAAQEVAAPTEEQGRLTVTGTMLGTPAYMSPEQFRSQPADARSDQFSFCVALYEALFDQRPFPGQTIQELSENVLAGRMGQPLGGRRVPSQVRAAIERGLSVRPEERYPRMHELLDDLVQALRAGRNSFVRQAAAKLAGAWDAPVDGRPVETPERAAIRAAFLATGRPYAATTFAAVAALLDRYARRWSDLYVEVCEATHERGEQSAEILDLRMACLNEGLEELKALCRLFREATPQVVENAVKAATALGTLERCQDVKLLRAVIRPPDDPATRALVERVRMRLVEVRALQRVGKWVAGLDAVRPLIDEARAADYPPMLAEVLLEVGLLKIDEAIVGGGGAALEEAFATAVYARHDEVAATAATLLIQAVGYVQGRLDAAEVWSCHAEALLRRLGGHEILWGWYLTARSNLREVQGRLAEAVEDSRRALAMLEPLGDAASIDIAHAMAALANRLAFGGDFAGALVEVERAIRVTSNALGPEHPHVTLFVANQAQYLYRLGRYDQGCELAIKALAVLEREADPRAIVATVPLRALGLCALAQGRLEAARDALERALSIREAIGTSSLRRAEVRAPLARALFGIPGQRERGLALARQAVEEYEAVALTPVPTRDLAELRAWLEGAARPAARAPRRRRPRPAPKRRAPTKKKPAGARKRG
jgi:tRNA A-37 threonylcarbamoyl transferase component Bud32/tetratricopeptide (TPR) repeat protein